MLDDIADYSENGYCGLMTMNREEAAAQPVDVNAEIGRRVHQLMWDRQMTQTTFGELTGMDQSSVAKRLRGKVGWPAAAIVDTARVLDTTIAYLFGETDSSQPAPPRGPSEKSKKITKWYIASAPDNVTEIDFRSERKQAA